MLRKLGQKKNARSSAVSWKQILWTGLLCALLAVIAVSTAGAEDTMTWAQLKALIEDGESPVTVTLTSDVTATESMYIQPIYILNGKTVTIDLNGHKIDRCRQSSGVTGGYIFDVAKGTTLTIRDSSAGGGGMLTGAYDADGHGCVYNNGTFTLESGSISGNRGSVENRGTFYMMGGSITANTAVAAVTNWDYMVFYSGSISGCYRGILNRTGGNVYMSGGSITQSEGDGIQNYGTVSLSGGIISANGSCGIYCYENGQIYLNGGEISGNNTAGHGIAGGIYLNDGCSLVISGGMITGNTGTAAGGIYADGTGSSINLQGGTVTDNTGSTTGGIEIPLGTLTISGNPVVFGNHCNNGGVPDLRVGYISRKIQISGPIGEDAQVGITGEYIGILTSGLKEKGGGVNPFISENSAYTVAVMGGEAAIGTAATISFDANGGSGSMDVLPVVQDIDTTAPACNFTAPEGKIFEGWLVGSGDTVIPAGGTYSVSGNTVMTAVWTDAPETMTWDELQSVITAGDGPVMITLPSDVTPVNPDSAQPLQIPTGKTVTIDLNGHNLDRGTQEYGIQNGYAINVQAGAALILKDTRGGGKLTGSHASGSIGCVFNLGSFTLDGVVIDGNYGYGVENYSADSVVTITGGGGIRDTIGAGIKNAGTVEIVSGFITGSSSAGIINEPGATVRLTDGTISGNGTSAVSNSGTFIMDGGIITGHQDEWGSNSLISGNSYSACSVQINGGSITGNTGYRNIIFLYESSTLTITGGEISGNEVTQSVISNSGTMAMTGGAIRDNIGTGIACYGEFRAAGSPVITGNTVDEASQNLVLWNGKKVTFTGVPGDDARIGIRIGSDYYQTTPFTVNFGGAATNNCQTFISDDSAYVVAVRDGEAFLADPENLDPLADETTITFAANGGGGSMNPVVNPDEDWTVSVCTFTAPEGKIFAGWQVGDDETRIVQAGSIMKVTESVVLTATWLTPGWNALQVVINNGEQNTIEYQLTEDVIANPNDPSLVIPAGKTVTIDLNGYTLNRNLMAETNSVYSYGIFVESGATLIIRDTSDNGRGKITGARFYINNGSCIENHGTLKLESGRIEGNFDGAVKNYGTFTITGGSITGNGHKTDNNLSVIVVNQEGGVTTMSGGSISGNDGDGIWNSGVFTFNDGTISRNYWGAIHVFESGTMTMSGGLIEENGNRNANAGGIDSYGDVVITGGTIQNNHAPYGWAVYSAGTLTMSGGSVINNESAGVCINNEGMSLSGKVTFGGNEGIIGEDSCDIKMAGSARIRLTDTLDPSVSMIIKTYNKPSTDNPVIITEGFYDADGTPRASVDQFVNKWESEYSHYYSIMIDGELAFSADEVYLTDEVWRGIQAEIDEAVESVTVVLTEDAVARSISTPLVIPAGKTVTIDLNGYTIDRNKYRSTTGYAIMVEEGATLNIRDSSANQAGRITGEKSISDTNNGCIINHGTLNLNSGSVAGNTNYGVVNHGTFTMIGGIVSGNSVGGIDNFGTFTLTDGNVTENGLNGYTPRIALYNHAGCTVTMHGGHIDGNTGYGIWNYGTFSMIDGTVSDNTYGGINVYEDCTMAMEGGTISGNGQSGSTYGGISIYHGMVTITGGTITGNKGLYAIGCSENSILNVTGCSICGNKAGGIDFNGSELVISGSVTFGSNVCETDNWHSCDVRLAHGKTISLGNGLDQDVTILIRTNDTPSSGNPITVTDGFLDETTGEPVAYASSFRSARNDAVSGDVQVMADGEIAFESGNLSLGTPSFVLPAGIRTIEAEAFAGIDASAVWIPDGAETIGSGAFANAYRLTRVYIPDSVTSIAADAFDEHIAIIIFGKQNSKAQEYAAEHDNITFRIYWGH